MPLTLSRRDGESIMIGDRIQVVVVGYRHGQVCLKIFAPPDVRVDRTEIWHRRGAGLIEPAERGAA